MTDALYWIAFGDLHDDIALLERIPELPGALGVIVTGDITYCGGVKQASRVIEAILGKNPVVYAQIGNMDLAEVTGWLEERGQNLHARARELFPGVFAMGVGYSPFTPFGTPSEAPESLLAEWMELGLAEAREQAGHYGPEGFGAGTRGLVLVSHTPPHGTACDRLANGVPVGSEAVRVFIEKYQPDLCLCGHIHESRAVDTLGRTVIINPGNFSAGGYALIRAGLENGKPYATAELKVVGE